MNFSLFVAKRLFINNRDVKKVSRPAIGIATIGVAIGVAVMIISVCIALGFKSEVHSKIIGFGSHIQVRNYSSLTGGIQQPITVTQEVIDEISEIDGIKHLQRFCDKEGILKTSDTFKGILLHGVGQEYDKTFLKENLIEGEIPDFSDSISSNKIVISRNIADELMLKVGDKVYSYFFDKTVRVRRFTVSAIYRSNLTEFDKVLVFTDIYTTNKLNGWTKDQLNGIEITLDDFNRLNELTLSVAETVKSRDDGFGNTHSALSIRELYPQIFSWLDLLDLNVWVILILMIAVAGFTMISGLLIIILERTNFIGLMKALGATSADVKKIFLYFSSLILYRGLLWGNVVGIGLVALQKYTGLIRIDPETYYVESIPVLFDVKLIIAINVVTAIVSMLVLLLPGLLISKIHPAKSIKFE